MKVWQSNTHSKSWNQFIVLSWFIKTSFKLIITMPVIYYLFNLLHSCSKLFWILFFLSNRPYIFSWKGQKNAQSHGAGLLITTLQVSSHFYFNAILSNQHQFQKANIHIQEENDTSLSFLTLYWLSPWLQNN